jgi:sodium-dependent dicarboxylate transporter 2/3/5
VQFWQQSFPLDTRISFARWLFFGAPVALLLLFAAWLILRSLFLQASNNTLTGTNAKALFDKPLPAAWSTDSKKVFIVLCITVILWLFREPIPLGGVTIPGWGQLLPKPAFAHESTVAIGTALALLLLPSSGGGTLLQWKELSHSLNLTIPLIFGGGFALAHGMEVSGLSRTLALSLNQLQGTHILIIIPCICLFVTALSEVASNVATAQLVLPVLLSLSQALNIDPLFLMLPAGFAASFGFALPVATAPNTLVYATGKVQVKHMAPAGVLLNFVSCIVLTLAVWLMMAFLQ